MYAPIGRTKGTTWQGINVAITRIMQEHCGAVKSNDLLRAGLRALDDLRQSDAAAIEARTPRELARVLEVESILTNAELVLHACLARRASSIELQFTHLDYPDVDPPAWYRFVTVRHTGDGVEEGSLPIDYYGSLPEQYERHSGVSQTRSQI